MIKVPSNYLYLKKHECKTTKILKHPYYHKRNPKNYVNVLKFETQGIRSHKSTASHPEYWTNLNLNCKTDEIHNFINSK